MVSFTSKETTKFYEYEGKFKRETYDKFLIEKKFNYQLDGNENCYPNCDVNVWLRSCEEEIKEPIEGKITGKWFTDLLIFLLQLAL